MKYMLLIYDNPDTRDVFFGPEGDALGGEMDSLWPSCGSPGSWSEARRLPIRQTPRPCALTAALPW